MTDQELINEIDGQQLYIAAAGTQGSARADSLRQALHKAHEMSAKGLSPTITRLPDQKIPAQQIHRLWTQVGLPV